MIATTTETGHLASGFQFFPMEIWPQGVREHVSRSPLSGSAGTLEVTPGKTSWLPSKPYIPLQDNYI